MKVSDFILQTRADLQEKNVQWKDEELLVKLQRSYIALQFDLPYFITKEDLVIKEGINEYYPVFTPIKNVSLTIDTAIYSFSSIENFYIKMKDKVYTFDGDKILINPVPTMDTTGSIVYKYQRELTTLNCEIELPVMYHKALRLLFMSEIHDKPTRNTKERVLSTHYIKLYKQEMDELTAKQKIRPIGLKSNYTGI